MSKRKRQAASNGWVKTFEDGPEAELMAEVTTTSLARAAELIDLTLRGRNEEAELLLATVPIEEARALALASVVHAATAYERTVGTVMGLSMLRTMTKGMKR